MTVFTAPRTVEEIERQQAAEFAIWHRKSMRDALDRELAGVTARIGHLTRQAEALDQQAKAASEFARPPIIALRDQALAQRAKQGARVEAIKSAMNAVK